MKKLMLLIIPFLLLVSCQKSKEEIAKELIDTNLKENLNDWYSYEPVRYGTLDTFYTSLNDNEYFNQVVEDITSYTDSLDIINLEIGNLGNEMALAPPSQKQINYYKSQIDLLSTKGSHFLRKIKEQNEIAKSMSNDFTPEFNGWKIEHSYRAKNTTGNFEIYHRIFYFDRNLTQITNIDDIEKNDGG